MTGRFEMGSTIVMVYEADPLTHQAHIQAGDKLKLGQPIVTTSAVSDLYV